MVMICYDSRIVGTTIMSSCYGMSVTQKLYWKRTSDTNIKNNNHTRASKYKVYIQHYVSNYSDTNSSSKPRTIKTPIVSLH